MMRFLLKCLGGHLEPGARIVRAHLGAGGGVAFVWVLILGIVLMPLAYLSYRRTAARISPVRRHTLVALRAVFFMLLLAFLSQPVLSLTVRGATRQTLVFLIDSSKSMTIRDVRLDDADKKRSAIALGELDPRKGLDQALAGESSPTPMPARADLINRALKDPRLGLLDELNKSVDLTAYSFSDVITPVAVNRHSNHTGLDPILATGTSTAIGDAIREVLRQKRGQPLAGIVMITDGGNNRGVPPADAAQLAANQGVPLFAYGVGVTSPHDIEVSNVFASRFAFAKEEFAVGVRVKSQGMIGRTVPMEIKLGDRIIMDRDLTLDHDGETVISDHFIPDEPGDYQLSASIAPQADEAVKDNNSASQPLRVIDGKIKVLYIESAPRWDFKYLQAMLLRDPRISANFVLLEGDPGISRVKGSAYLPAIPSQRSELFHFNLIIIGDVSSEALSKAQQDDLVEFVSKLGGAVIFIAGQNSNPASYVNTPLEQLLPIVPGGEQRDFSNPIQLQLTNAGASDAMLALSDNDVENARRWASLPPVYWTAAVMKPKPAAQVLLADGDPSRLSGAQHPVMALQNYGIGQVLFVGTDETWRWRKNALVPLHDALWSQIIQRLGLPNLLGLSQRIQLTSDKEKYVQGETVTVFARVYGSNFEPLSAPSVKGTCAAGTMATIPATLAAVPGQPGLFQGEFVPTDVGQYHFDLNDSTATPLTFEVEESKLELGDAAMNEQLLRDLATTSGGQFLREEDLFKLPDLVRSRAIEVESEVDADLWSSPLMFGLILCVVSTEWIMRKTARLK